MPGCLPVRILAALTAAFTMVYPEILQLFFAHRMDTTGCGAVLIGVSTLGVIPMYNCAGFDGLLSFCHEHSREHQISGDC
jgi:hypothetical protein